MPTVLTGLVFASVGWGQESPPSTGTGTPCCRHHAWLHSPGKPVGRRKKGSGQVGGNSMALVGLEGPVPSHCIPLPQLEGLDVQGIHTCSGSVRCMSPFGDTAQPRPTWGRMPRDAAHPTNIPNHLPLPGRAVQAAFPAPQNCPSQGWLVPALCLLAALGT